MEMKQERVKIHQILLKFLDGKHRAFNFTTPTITVETLKHEIQTLTSIPSHLQLLLLQFNQTKPMLLQNDHQILNLVGNYGPHSGGGDSSLIMQHEVALWVGKPLGSEVGPAEIRPPVSGDGKGKFPTVVHLLLRLRGGKGGFGSLLRGAATKAGQKKTNNFDACRDMSGRRLRHVNAEKRLEEWRAEAEERKLEKMAEEFIKKKAKELKKGKGKGGMGEAVDKYVDKYREDSAKCMEEVERSVRESMKGLVAASKRKKSEGNESHSKRFKIWMGKRALADSDSEDMDDDNSDEEEEGENNKSVITDNENHSDSSKESDRTLDSVTDAKHDVIFLDGVPSQSGSEEEKEMGAEETGISDESTGDHAEDTSVGQPDLGVSEVKTTQEVEIYTPEEEVCKKSDSSDVVERESQPSAASSSGKEEASSAKVDGNSTSKPSIQDEVVTTNVEAPATEMPLNLEDFNSASELEVLGMEILKTELQARGLKCGGTLQERAARLFLLKTTPLEKLPKKLLAKK